MLKKCHNNVCKCLQDNWAEELISVVVGNIEFCLQTLLDNTYISKLHDSLSYKPVFVKQIKVLLVFPWRFNNLLLQRELLILPSVIEMTTSLVTVSNVSILIADTCTNVSETWITVQVVRH